MTIAGVTSGVGSMLIGAKELGYEVLGNVEWRNYYNTGTFEKNFNAPYTTDYSDIGHLKGADVVMVHDDCGSFSNLNRNSKYTDHSIVCGRIQASIDAVKEIGPKFFAMDNLPKMLLTTNAAYWHEQFPDYDIHFEWVSNYGYGNIQKFRNRLFIIGSKKDLNFKFIANEINHDISVMDTISGCEGLPNHLSFPVDKRSYYKPTPEQEAISYGELAEIFKVLKSGEPTTYISNSREEKKNIGRLKLHSNKYSHTLMKEVAHYHPITGMPLTVRERARIQGFPDWFEFVISDKQHYNPIGMKQTGKAMPIQFTSYLAKIFKQHIEDGGYSATGTHIIKPNEIIEEANKCMLSLTQTH